MGDLSKGQACASAPLLIRLLALGALAALLSMLLPVLPADCTSSPRANTPPPDSVH